ncbi:MAG: 8-oxo-dGTP diphosphatase [Christensenellaceae bacterium]|nr:8-oxo-dGTP diphosphatase [Christensenellaceae bacterium]
MAHKTENTVLTNMCMIYDGDMVLVMDGTNEQWPGITFPGGHVKPGESITGSCIREVYEETGLKVSGLKLCGLKQWTDAGKNYRYIVFFFKTDRYEGELRGSREGRPFWTKKEGIREMDLGDGFDAMLDVFFSDYLQEDYFHMEDGKWIEEIL